MQILGSSVFVISAFVALSFWFSSCGLHEEDGPTPASYDLYVKERNYFPAFSPDGEKIVYCHLNYEYPEPVDYPSGIYIIDRDGGNRTKILEGKFYTPAWSPDGEYLVFSNQGAIQKCKVSGDDWETFTGLDTLENPGFFYPDWSPDGKYIVFDSPFRTQGNLDEGGLYAIDADLSDPRFIFDIHLITARDPEISPDGKSFVFMDRVEDSSISWEIFIMDTLGVSKVRLTDDRRDDRDPTWSPNGAQIAWASEVKICVMNSDGTGRQEITYGQFPSWSVNNEIVFSFANSDYTAEELYLMNPDGSNKRQITF